jgi:methionine aminopeptidase
MIVLMWSGMENTARRHWQKNKSQKQQIRLPTTISLDEIRKGCFTQIRFHHMQDLVKISCFFLYTGGIWIY